MLDTQVLTSNSTVRLRRFNANSGEPTLMLHGLGGTGLNWRLLANLFGTSLDILAPDLPGFGLSTTMNHDSYKPKNFAQTMAEVVLNQFGEKKVHLFGNSHGGTVAIYFAAMYPELTKSLTLISPAMPDLVPQLSAAPVVLSAIPGLGEQLLGKFYELPPEERAKTNIKQNFYDATLGEKVWQEDLLQEMRTGENLGTLKKVTLATLRNLLLTYFDNSSQSPWNLAKEIKVPCLFIYGGKDKLVNPRARFKVTKYFPKSKVLFLPKIGHVAHIENPDRVQEFFTKHLFSNPGDWE
jgi:pimeloyl-ACP methyl ester carboxylesterase